MISTTPSSLRAQAHLRLWLFRCPLPLPLPRECLQALPQCCPLACNPPPDLPAAHTGAPRCLWLLRCRRSVQRRAFRLSPSAASLLVTLLLTSLLRTQERLVASGSSAAAAPSKGVLGSFLGRLALRVVGSGSLTAEDLRWVATKVMSQLRIEV